MEMTYLFVYGLYSCIGIDTDFVITERILEVTSVYGSVDGHAPYKLTERPTLELKGYYLKDGVNN